MHVGGSKEDLVSRLRPALPTAKGIRSREVSMPSRDIFDHQSREYRDQVLPPPVKHAPRSSLTAWPQLRKSCWAARDPRR